MPKVLVIDDSPSIRRALTSSLGAVADIVVMGAVGSAEAAQQFIAEQRPDVLTLDMALPGMSGLEFLSWLSAHANIPTVVLSAVAPADGRLALKALDMGAAEVICKPGPGRPNDVVIEELVRAIRLAGRTKLKSPQRTAPVAPPVSAPPAVSAAERPLQRHLIAIGASTGGTKAVEVVLRQLPAWTPPVVVVQHMPAGFTNTFAIRLNSVCEITVREAVDGERLVSGVALIAPGGYHLSVEKRSGGYVARVHDGERVHHQRPAVDVLFKSVAACAGPDAVAALLTGMGADGADGMKVMLDRGANTIAEDESTCVVYGMPFAAVKLGAAREVLPLPAIAAALLNSVAPRIASQALAK